MQWFQKHGWKVHVAANSNNRFKVSGFHLGLFSGGGEIQVFLIREFYMNRNYLYIFGCILFTVYGQLIIKWRMSQKGHLPAELADKLLFLRKNATVHIHKIYKSALYRL